MGIKGINNIVVYNENEILILTQKKLLPIMQDSITKTYNKWKIVTSIRKEDRTMTNINTFLQKRKMHENHHGIIMVSIAYVLSFLMLFFGSDTFYNINSRAERLNNKPKEETHEMINTKLMSVPVSEIKTKTLNKDVGSADLIPNDLDNTSSAKINSPMEVNNDTEWLLGISMNDTEYDNLLKQMESHNALPEKASESVNSNKGTIKSYSKIKKGSVASKGISSEDVQMLERIVEAEATGEDMIGRILIANVIFNRISSKRFPHSVKDVIFQRSNGDYQFSPVSDKRFWSVSVTEKTKEAVSRALKGEDYSGGALYFMARRGTSKTNAKWFDNHLNRLFKHGGHEFYK